MVVVDRYLPNRARPAQGKMSTRRGIAEQCTRDCIPGFDSQEPRLHNRRDADRRPTNVEWSSAFEHEYDWLLGRDHRIDEFHLLAGQFKRRTRACLAAHSGQFTYEQHCYISF